MKDNYTLMTNIKASPIGKDDTYRQSTTTYKHKNSKMINYA